MEAKEGDVRVSDVDMEGEAITARSQQQHGQRGGLRVGLGVEVGCEDLLALTINRGTLVSLLLS